MVDIIWLDKFQATLADQLCRAIAQYPLDRWRDVKKYRVLIDNGNNVGTLFDQRTKTFLAGRYGLFCLFALESLIGLKQGAPYYWTEPLEIVLEHVVRRALLEAFDCHFFAQHAGNKDEGHIKVFCLSDLQRRLTIETW